MKKIFSWCSLFLMFTLVISVTPLTAYAQTDGIKQKEIEYLDDGSYFENTIYIEKPETTLYSTEKIRKGHRIVTHYSAKDVKLWSITVNGTYSYNGTTAKCVSCSSSKEVFKKTWKVNITSTTKSGNCASTTAQGKHYTNGKVDKTITKTVSLRCKANGTLY